MESTAGQFVDWIIDTVMRRAVLFGTHVYRVISQTDDALNLQAVSTVAGLPHQVDTPKAHGVPGASSECAPGSLVVVAFKGGSRASPYVVSYLDSVPVRIVLDAQTEMRLGADATQGVARLGDTVTVLLQPAVFTGTINGLPATGMVVWSPGQTTGTITTSSAKVKSE